MERERVKKNSAQNNLSLEKDSALSLQKNPTLSTPSQEKAILPLLRRQLKENPAAFQQSVHRLQNTFGNQYVMGIMRQLAPSTSTLHRKQRPHQKKVLDTSSSDLTSQVMGWLNPFAQPGGGVSLEVTVGLEASLKKVLAAGGQAKFQVEFSCDDHNMFHASVTFGAGIYGKVNAWVLKYKYLKEIKRQFSVVNPSLRHLVENILKPLRAIIRTAKAILGKEVKKEPKTPPGMTSVTGGSPSTHELTVNVGGAEIETKYQHGSPTTTTTRERNGEKEYTVSKSSFHRFSLGFQISKSIAAQFEFELEEISGDPLANNDGKYADLKIYLKLNSVDAEEAILSYASLLRAKGSLVSTFESVKQAFSNGKAVKQAIQQLVQKIKKLFKATKNQLKQPIAGTPWGKEKKSFQQWWKERQKGSKKQFSPNVEVAFQFHWIHSKSHWKLQYFRLLKTLGIDFSQSIPLTAVLSAELGVSFQGTKNLFEIAGTDTISYFQTRAAGLAFKTGYLNFSGESSSWEKFFQAWKSYAKSNRGSLASLFQNIAQGSKSVAYQELDKKFEHAKLFIEACKSFAKNPKDGTLFNQCVDQMGYYFVQVLPSVAMKQKGWKRIPGTLDDTTFEQWYKKRNSLDIMQYRAMIEYCNKGGTTQKWEEKIAEILTSAGSQGKLPALLKIIPLTLVLRDIDNESPMRTSSIMIAHFYFRHLSASQVAKELNSIRTSKINQPALAFGLLLSYTLGFSSGQKIQEIHNQLIKHIRFYSGWILPFKEREEVYRKLKNAGVPVQKKPPSYYNF
ncbi:MAG: hypothetical protein D6805_05330 [Planctomycetota bacterium]|nr:MAG: hypothetical protein D6805_05330 [Planctomycetota bacterium]